MAAQRPSTRTFDGAHERRLRPQGTFVQPPDRILGDQSYYHHQAALHAAKLNPPTTQRDFSTAPKNPLKHRNASIAPLKNTKSRDRRPSEAELYKKGAVDHLRQADPQFLQPVPQAYGQPQPHRPPNAHLHTPSTVTPLPTLDVTSRHISSTHRPHLPIQTKPSPQYSSQDGPPFLPFPTGIHQQESPTSNSQRTHTVSDAGRKSNGPKFKKTLSVLPENSPPTPSYPPVAGFNSRPRKQSSVGSNTSSRQSGKSLKDLISGGLKRVASWRKRRKDEQTDSDEMKTNLSPPTTKDQSYHSEGHTNKLVTREPSRLQKLTSASRTQKRMTPLTMVDHQYDHIWQDAGLTQRVLPHQIPPFNLTRSRTKSDPSDPSVTLVDSH